MEAFIKCIGLMSLQIQSDWYMSERKKQVFPFLPLAVTIMPEYSILKANTKSLKMKINENSRNF